MYAHGSDGRFMCPIYPFYNPRNATALQAKFMP